MTAPRSTTALSVAPRRPQTVQVTRSALVEGDMETVADLMDVLERLVEAARAAHRARERARRRAMQHEVA